MRSRSRARCRLSRCGGRASCGRWQYSHASPLTQRPLARNRQGRRHTSGWPTLPGSSRCSVTTSRPVGSGPEGRAPACAESNVLSAGIARTCSRCGEAVPAGWISGSPTSGGTDRKRARAPGCSSSFDSSSSRNVFLTFQVQLCLNRCTQITISSSPDVSVWHLLNSDPNDAISKGGSSFGNLTLVVCDGSEVGPGPASRFIDLVPKSCVKAGLSQKPDHRKSKCTLHLESQAAQNNSATIP